MNGLWRFGRDRLGKLLILLGILLVVYYGSDSFTATRYAQRSLTVGAGILTVGILVRKW